MTDIQGLRLLRRIEEGVAGKSGEAFFRQIVRDIADALNAHAAFTSQLQGDKRAAMKAFWVKDRYEKCLEYSLAGTPCEFVYAGRITSYARDIGKVFPVDRDWFAELGVNSYLGIPIKNENGEVFGHLAVMDTAERDWHDADLDVLRLFSMRTAVELERARAQKLLEDSNQSLRHMNEQLTHEVNQRIAMERELAAAKLVAENANQAKSVFISQMSHELRTPLNGILGYAQLLRRGANLDEQQRDGLAVIERSGDHLLNLVNDLLDLARIEAGKLELREQPLDLGSLLHHVRDLIAVRADKAGLKFRFEVAPTLPVQIIADERALRQVLLNLLGNAVKFTNVGGQLELRVDARALNGKRQLLQFQVSDSGIGIDAAQLARIFEPFHRVTDPERPAEGTGLGLAITQRLVEAMSGSIRVESEVGHGTTFVVEIDVEQLPVVANAARQVPDIIGYRGARRSILVADDDAANRSLLQRLLTDLGFDLRVAADGARAWELFAARPPQLLITDLVMPKLNGLALVRAVRTSHLPHVPVIVISASASGYTSDEALQAGCNAFVPKPLRLPALLQAIGSALDLEWKYAADQAAVPGIATTACDFTPQREHVDELYHLAMLGDITTLVERAHAMFAADSAARMFLDRLQTLATQYDTGAIRQLLSASDQRVH